MLAYNQFQTALLSEQANICHIDTSIQAKKKRKRTESQTAMGVSASGLCALVSPSQKLQLAFFNGIVLRWRARGSHVKTTGENTLNQNKHVQDNNPPCRISVKQRTPDLTGGARLKAVLWQLLGDCRGCLLTQNELISPRLGFIGLARA